MRLVALSQVAMASSYAVCRLHMRGRFGLAKSLQKVATRLKRNVGTNVAAVQGEALRKDKAGSCF